MKKLFFLFVGVLCFMSSAKADFNSDNLTTICTATVYVNGEAVASFSGLSIFNDEFGAAQACHRAKEKALAWIAENL